MRKAAEIGSCHNPAPITRDMLEQLQQEMLPERWYARMDYFNDCDMDELEAVSKRRQSYLRKMTGVA